MGRGGWARGGVRVSEQEGGGQLRVGGEGLMGSGICERAAMRFDRDGTHRAVP